MKSYEPMYESKTDSLCMSLPRFLLENSRYKDLGYAYAGLCKVRLRLRRDRQANHVTPENSGGSSKDRCERMQN